MAFMELFTEHGDWYVYDGNAGGGIIPADVLNADEIKAIEDEDFDVLLKYTESRELWSVEKKTGWCARYSAPGYMDATDWCGPYETEKEAAEECRQMYGDES